MKLQNLTWPEVAKIDRLRTLVVAPIAACEQHSRHLPTFTDSILCGEVAAAVEANLRDRVLLLPLLWLGASDHHLPFGATLSVHPDTHVTVLTQLLTPLLDDGFQRVLILNGHGGNIETLRLALRLLQPRYSACLLTGASYWELAEQEIAQLATGERKAVGHACEIETALVMHWRPDLVRASEIRDDHRTEPAVLRGLYVAQDMSQRTTAGCIGLPARATPETGRRLADAIVARATELCRHLTEQPIPLGRRRQQRES